MLSFLLIFLGIAILCFVLLRLFLNSSPARIRKLLTWAIGFILLAVAVFFCIEQMVRFYGPYFLYFFPFLCA